MQTTELKATQSTPYVLLRDDGEFYLRGRSYMEDAETFYRPILHWLDTFLQCTPPQGCTHPRDRAFQLTVGTAATPPALSARRLCPPAPCSLYGGVGMGERQ